MAELRVLESDASNELNGSRLQLITDQIRPHLSQTFGYNALLYSPLAAHLCGDQLSIKNQIVINELDRRSEAPFSQNSQSISNKIAENVSVICSFLELPIASDCIDLAVLPNILQNTANPHQVLREVERVLIPEGVVILIGRNPFSWQGIRNMLRHQRDSSQKQSRDISRWRIADWFGLLGFETENIINISLSNEKLQNSQFYPWIKRAGQYFCDYFCSYYIIIAKKKVSTLTPIRPSWRRNKQLVPSRLAEPNVRSQVENWFEQNR